MARNNRGSSSWRNAACITMLSGPFQYCASPKDFKRTPIIRTTGDKKEEPEILFVKRHPKSRSLANTYVFPGGALDPSDYSRSWMSVFSNYRQPFDSILSLRDAGLPIFKAVPQGNPLAGEIAFRICAIREFFEEAGILLARSKAEVDSIIDFFPGTFPPSILKLPATLLDKWRSRVHSDASQFIEMCKELECVPDIWSLIEWSDWLTPRYLRHRYDTLFYLCFCEQKPQAIPDLAEVTEAQIVNRLAINVDHDFVNDKITSSLAKETEWFSPSCVNILITESVTNFSFPQLTDVRKLQSMCGVGGLPLTHLFTLHQSATSGGIMCKKTTRIGTKDGGIAVTSLDDLSPRDPEDTITHLQFPTSSELTRRGVTLTLSDNDTWCEYKIQNFTASELREMSVAINRTSYTDLHMMVSDTVEIRQFRDFIVKFQRTKL